MEVIGIILLLIIAFIVLISDGKVFIKPITLDDISFGGTVFAGKGFIHTVFQYIFVAVDSPL